MAGFRDLLDWLLGWRSSAPVAVGVLADVAASDAAVWGVAASDAVVYGVAASDAAVGVVVADDASRA